MTSHSDESSLTVLLIEADDLEAVRVRRELEGSVVRWVRTQREGVQAARRDGFDAVIVNVCARGEDPRKLLSGLAASVSRGAPILALSRIEDDRFAQELIRCGADDVIATGELHATRLMRRVRIAIERAKKRLVVDETDAAVQAYKGEVGQVVAARFRISAHLGAGAAGAVYRARDLREGAEVALKLLHPWLVASEEARARFEFEAKAGRALRHPNLVRVIDFGHDEGHYYIATEYVGHGNLLEHLTTHGALSGVELVSMFEPLARGLAHAHGAGVIHRDIKPANILLTEATGGLVAKLADFGVAKLVVRTSETLTGAVVGTLKYMAPEQFRDSKNVDHRADIYGLAASMKHALTGVAPPPFSQHPSRVAAVAPAEASRHVDPNAPLHALISRCLAEDPAARIQSCDELADELASLVGVFETSKIRTPALPPNAHRMLTP